MSLIVIVVVGGIGLLLAGLMWAIVYAARSISSLVRGQKEPG